MHLRGPGGAAHADDLAGGGAADDGVVDQDDTLAFEQRADGVELHADAEVAHTLLGLNKGAADVVVADEAEVEGDAGFGGVAQGGGDAGVGHGDDEVGGDGGLAGELATHLIARLLDGAAEDAGVGAGEVDVLEDAGRLGGVAVEEAAGDAVFGDHDELAGLDVALVLGMEEVEGAGFAGEDEGVWSAVGAGDAAHGKGAEAVWIAGGEDAIARHHNDGEGAVDLAEGVGDAVDEGALGGVGDELDDDLGVGGGLEDGAVALESLAGGAKVDEVAVVGDGDEAAGALDGDGLGVEEGGVAGGGVAGVADGEVAGETGEDGVGEDFADEAHALEVGDGVGFAAVGDGNAGGLLAAVLEGVEAPVGEASGVGVVVDGHHAAVFAEFVEGG